MEVKHQIKLTVTEDMYQELQLRAKSMSISVPAMICYVVGEKLAQQKLAEQAAVRLLSEQVDSLVKLEQNQRTL